MKLTQAERLVALQVREDLVSIKENPFICKDAAEIFVNKMESLGVPDWAIEDGEWLGPAMSGDLFIEYFGLDEDVDTPDDWDCYYHCWVRNLATGAILDLCADQFGMGDVVLLIDRDDDRQVWYEGFGITLLEPEVAQSLSA